MPQLGSNYIAISHMLHRFLDKQSTGVCMCGNQIDAILRNVHATEELPLCANKARAVNVNFAHRNSSMLK